MGWQSETVEKLGNALLEFLNTVEPAGDASERAAKQLAELANSGKIAADDMDAFNQAVKNGELVFNSVTGEWESASLTLIKLKDGTQGAVDEFGNFYRAITDGTGDVIQYERVISDASGALVSFGDDASAAGADSKKLQTELDKLASDERLKQMEFNLELNIANVQGNAEIAKAAFESLSTTIQSTGDLLGTLYGLLVDPDNAGYVNKILDQIEKENAAREAAFKAQQDWFQANIDYLNARTERIKSDEALIQIDGAGLQPHLEAFMFEILAAIQVRLNEEGLELLTGIDAPLPAPA
jgi:hypothetical protein